MTWFASAAVKLVGAATVAALLSLGAVSALAQSTPSASATSVATKATPAEKAAYKAIKKATFDAEALALGMTSDQLRDAILNHDAKVSDLAKAKGYADKKAFGAAVAAKMSGPNGTLAPLLKAGTITEAQATKAIDRVNAGHVPFWNGKHHHRPKK